MKVRETIVVDRILDDNKLRILVSEGLNGSEKEKIMTLKTYKKKLRLAKNHIPREGDVYVIDEKNRVKDTTASRMEEVENLYEELLNRNNTHV